MFRKIIRKLFGGDGVVEDDAQARPPSTLGKTLAERRGVPPPLELPDDPAERLKVLLLNGRKIEAIKVYRDMTGVALAQAKADMDALEKELEASGAIAENGRRPAATAEEWLPQVYALLEADNKIGAIKLYREMADVGLKEAKDAVDGMERGQRPAVLAPAALPPAPPSLDSVMPEIIAFVQQGKKINAIKLYREATGMGLKESKEAVEEIERQVR
jgi:ribosomal protein L7/L12